MKKVIIKIIGAILTVALLLPVVAVLNTGAMRRYGDVDGDGNVGSVDYLMVKRAVLGSFDLNEIQTVAADVDKSGAVGAVDYLIIKRTVLGSYDLTEYFDDSAVHIHQYVAGETVDPGCETRGYTVYRCYCGAEVHSDFTDPLGHDYYTTGYQESTCTVPGYEDAHCRRCGHDEHTVLPLAQHDFYNVHANLNHVDGNPHFVEYASCRTCGQNNLVKSEVTVYSCVSESGDPLHPDAYGKGGSVSAYLASGALYLTATAGDYYKFLGWSDGCTDRSRLYESASDVCAVFGYDTHVMPVVSIKTETGEQVTHRDYYLNCSITVNNCDDKYAKDNASAKIRVRGNASSNYGDPEYAKTNKVHYRIKFDKKTSFLGVNDDAKCKSWVLLRGDSAFMREPLGFKMFEDACQGAYFSSDYTFVQVYINYDYYGAYVLCEQTQIQENRINIDEKKDEDTKLRTGYLVEIDNYWQNEDYTFIMDYDNVWLTDMYGVTKQARQAGYSVKYDVMTWDQLNYISKYIHNVYKIVYQAIYENRYYKLNGNNDLVLAQNEFSSAEACVGNVLDLEAAAAMYISREVAAERDGGIGSFFMYVDFTADHPRLTFCAPWDYSWAYGTSEGFAMEHFWVSAFQPEEFAYAGNRSFTWFITLYKSSFFKNIVKRQWREMNTRGDQQGWLDELDRVATVYADDFAMNTRRWNSGDQATASGYIREFVRQRIQWLNSQWL